MTGAKAAGVLLLNGVALALSTVPKVDAAFKLAQIFSLLAAGLFALVQLVRYWRRMRHEKKLYDWITEAQKQCVKAKAGDCPLADKLEKLEAEK